MTALERLLATDPAARRCYQLVTGQIPNPTLDDVAACYGATTVSPTAVKLADFAVADGRIPFEHRDAWVERLTNNPGFALDVLADLPPRRDRAEAEWWRRQGDALFAELDAYMHPGREMAASDDPEEERLYSELATMMRLDDGSAR